MIIGSGLMARAFQKDFSNNNNIYIYAAGVSNSNCDDGREFLREKDRLVSELEEVMHVDAFVYFSTCSVHDSEKLNTAYVQHKLNMENIVRKHPKNLIFRLPQVAGNTPNPHTLLNFLYARIARSESFMLWRNARRNIIDVDDVVSIAKQLITNSTIRNATYNIANLNSYSMYEIVDAMAQAIGKQAVFETKDRGSSYEIDISPIQPVVDALNINFSRQYLNNIVNKYYGVE